MKKSLFLILIIFNYLSLNVFADERLYMSLKNDTVNVRFGPGLNYPIKYIYNKKNYPILVIDEIENFRKIIDHKKNTGWIHISQLKKNNSFISKKNLILFSKPSNFSKPIAKIEQGRLLVKKKCKAKWCNVKTDIYNGWIKLE